LINGALDDAEACARCIESISPGQQPFKSAVKLATSFSDPVKAVAWLRNLGEGDFGERAVAEYFQDARPDIETTMAIVNSLPEDVANRVDFGSLKVGLRDSPDFERLGSWLSDKDRRGDLYHLGSMWTGANPDEAMAFADQLNEPLQKRAVLEGAYSTLTRQNPVAMLEALDELPADHRQSIQESAMSQLGHHNPDELSAYVESLPVDEQQGGKDFRHLHLWTLQDPAGVANWLLQLDDREGRSDALLIAMGRWLDIDSHAASHWIEQMPAGPLRDGSISALVEEIYKEDPDAARAWIDQIDNKSVRGRALNRWEQR
jgi:hypothetical protein